MAPPLPEGEGNAQEVLCLEEVAYEMGGVSFLSRVQEGSLVCLGIFLCRVQEGILVFSLQSPRRYFSLSILPVSACSSRCTPVYTG